MVYLLLWLYRSDPAFAERPTIDLLKRGEGVKQVFFQLLVISDLNAHEAALIIHSFLRG